MSIIKPTLQAAPHLKLRPLAPADATALFALIDKNRDYIGRYLAWVSDTTAVGHSRSFIENCLREWESGSAAHFGIFYEDTLAGHISLMEIAPGHKAAIGYWLDQSWAGRGIMKQSTQALIEFGFRTYALKRLLIRARVGNGPSSGVAKALGFKLEGVEHLGERYGEEFFDLEHYYLLADEVTHAR